MKNRANIIIISLLNTICIALIILVFPMSTLTAQEGNDSVPVTAEKITPVLKLSSIKNSDESRTLVAVLTYKNKETKETFDIKGVAINFFAGVDSLVKLGTVETDLNGRAACNIKSGFVFPKNEEGLIHFSAESAGNDNLEEASGELDVKDLIITMSLEVIDSVKTVSIKVEQVNGKNERIPLNEIEVPVFVARMFSHLKVGTITLAEGEGTMEFPGDLPGDTLGNLVVIAKFDESDEYGTVMKSDTINWGYETKHINAYSPRSLWTQVAPVWMIITLSIMLLGVWGHYIFVIIQLIRLKMGQKKTIN